MLVYYCDRVEDHILWQINAENQFIPGASHAFFFFFLVTCQPHISQAVYPRLNCSISRKEKRLAVGSACCFFVPADMIYSTWAGFQQRCSQGHKKRQLPVRRGCCYSVQPLAGTRHLHHTLSTAGIVWRQAEQRPHTQVLLASPHTLRKKV